MTFDQCRVGMRVKAGRSFPGCPEGSTAVIVRLIPSGDSFWGTHGVDGVDLRWISKGVTMDPTARSVWWLEPAEKPCKKERICRP